MRGLLLNLKFKPKLKIWQGKKNNKITIDKSSMLEVDLMANSPGDGTGERTGLNELIKNDFG